MVDAERVAALIQRLRGEIAYLDRRAGEDRGKLRADQERLSGLKYRFVTALETVVNIAQHLCAAEGWGPPTSNADSVVRLAANDVLDDALASRLARAVGFRNVLVSSPWLSTLTMTASGLTGCASAASLSPD